MPGANLLTFTSPLIFRPLRGTSQRSQTSPLFPGLVRRAVSRRLPCPIQCSSVTANTADLSAPSDFPKPPSPPAYSNESKRGAILRFIQLSKSHWRLFVPALCAAFIASICSVFQPVLYGRILGLLALAHTMPYDVARRMLFERVLKIALFYIVEMTTTVCFVSLTTRAVDRVTRELRELVFAKVWKNDIGFFDSVGRSEIERKLATEIRTVRESVWTNLSRDRGIRGILEVTLGLALALRTTGALGAPIFGVLVPTIAILVARMGMQTGRYATQVASQDSAIQLYLNERIRGVRTVKAFGAERREGRSLTKLLDNSTDRADKLGKGKAVLEAATRLSIYLTIITLMILGGLLICSGKLTFETFSCMTGFIWILNFAIQGVSYTVTDMSRMSASLRSIYKLLDDAEAYSSRLGAVAELADTESQFFDGHVQFHSVRFHYPSKPDVEVLKGVSFAIRPGQVVALVGNSGGGKSTVAAMLSRFYAPTSGMITIDDVDSRLIPTQNYRRNVSVVDQDPVLFQGSIRENIAYGLPEEELDDDTIIRAAKDANAHDFIVSLKEGYDSTWTPASNLSGGQKQRIAIARSLVKSPRILVLDEATSALDQESERMVQDALEKVMKHRSVLVIAHRLSTVRTADAILVVKDGQIVERGTYDELITRPNGNFKALVEAATEVEGASARTI